MQAARYYIYWNLHKHCWSVKHRGKVIQHLYDKHVMCKDVEFKVSEAGRQRVIKEGRKNVHAYVACTWYAPVPNKELYSLQVHYNPYKDKGFRTGAFILDQEPSVLLRIEDNKGRVYI